MPLFPVVVRKGRAVPRDDSDLREGLRARLARPGPIVVMIHGYKFHPDVTLHDPLGHIFSLTPKPCFKAVSWPAALGFDGARADEGLCIPFTWPARGLIREVYRAAAVAGEAFAGLLHTIIEIAPGRRVQVIAHSMGARVFLEALRTAPARSVNRAILLSGAEYQARAEAAMDSAAGRTCAVFNVTSRENDLFDCLFEWGIRSPRRWDRALGAGLRVRRPNWLDIQIDDPATLSALAMFGFEIGAPTARVCHWSTYIRPGVFVLYAALLRRPEVMPLATLRKVLPSRPTRRWSRMVALPFGVAIPATWRRRGTLDP
ncbi:MAG: alpha/beta hydrolase [Shimia sp.]